MITKKQIDKMVTILVPILIEEWELKKYTFHVEALNYHKMKKKHEEKWIYDNGKCHGWSSVEGNHVNICIFADRQKGKWDAIDTIIHEMLHVKLHDLTTLTAKTKTKRAIRLE